MGLQDHFKATVVRVRLNNWAVTPFERHCMIISGIDIADDAGRQRLINNVEYDIFILNRLNSGKMTTNHAKQMFRMRRPMEMQDLRELLEQLKNYKPN